MNPIAFLIPFAIVLASLTIHEAAHAWTADRLGDPTARLLGRVSLNPIAHVDWIGTVLLPLIAMYSHLPIIGWAKPVPVNASRLREPRRDFMLVAAAGPLSNLLQAVVAALVMRGLFAMVNPDLFTIGARYEIVEDVLIRVVEINVLLALFNLIPVPPLDGGNVLAGLLPRPAAMMFVQLQRYGFLVLYALILTGALSAIIMPPTAFLLRILIP